MATPTVDLFSVRTTTVDGLPSSEVENLENEAAWALFDDLYENTEEGYVIQILAADGTVVAEELTGL